MFLFLNFVLFLVNLPSSFFAPFAFFALKFSFSPLMLGERSFYLIDL